MALPTSVRFDLDDGTSVTAEGPEVRRIYEWLWARPDLPGAFATAAVLLDEAGRYPRRQSIDLGPTQSAALRRALNHFANPSYY